MTTAADDSAVEDAFEALLAGRPVPEGAAGLAAFTGAVRTSATRPGRPNAALAELLATGLLTDQSSPSTRTARSAGSPPVRRSSRVRIRRRAAMIFPVLIAKFLSAGAIAQAATGAGVVVVAFTGIGAAGALPAPVQDTFATVVETVTPLEAPTSDETADDVVDGTVVEEVIVTEPTEEVAETEPTEEVTETVLTEEQQWAEEGPAAGQSFGSWVSEGARRGWVDGKVISEWAHKKHVQWDGETGPATPTAEPAEAEVEDRSAETEAATGDREGKRGNGDGNGHDNDRGNGSGHGNGGGNGRN